MRRQQCWQQAGLRFLATRFLRLFCLTDIKERRSLPLPLTKGPKVSSDSSSGQTEWRHYATLHHARSMGQAAALDDGSILLLGGQVPCVFVVLLCSYCDCNNTLTFIGKTTPRDVYCPVGKRRKECSRLTQPAVTMIPTAPGGRRSRRWRG